MYTLVGILLALVLVGMFVSIYRNHRRKIHEAKRWLASQPPEVIISGRKRAAEKGRALLEEQIDCDNFIEEFGQSQDPEIQELVAIVATMIYDRLELNEYRGYIEKQILVLEHAKIEDKGSTSS
jgi:hypothetical protein